MHFFTIKAKLYERFGGEKNQHNSNCDDLRVAENCSERKRRNGKVKAGSLQPVSYSQPETISPYSSTKQFEKNRVSALVTFLCFVGKKVGYDTVPTLD